MENEKKIRSEGQTVCAYDFRIKYSPEMKLLKDRIFKAYKDGRYEMPRVDEIIQKEKDETNARHVIDAMASEGLLVRLNYQYYIEKKAFKEELQQLNNIITENGSVTLAEFRDILGTSRKYAMTILDYLDQQKVTRKEGDIRVLY